MRLNVIGLTLSYGGAPVVDDVTLAVEAGELVAIVGPNGGGKSTLLRGIARLHRPRSGAVEVDGEDIRRLNSRAIARKLAILPQSPAAGLDLTVRELVWRGRYPHQGILQRPTRPDFEAVERALHATDTYHLAGRPLASLSGGERQRAWIALALAQEPRILLLDEPTSFLDLQHQVEVMDLLRALNRDGIAVLAVLHDLSVAARYADRIIALRAGRVEFDGPPADVLTSANLERVFSVRMTVLTDPETGLPVPLARSSQPAASPGFAAPS